MKSMPKTLRNLLILPFALTILLSFSACEKVSNGAKSLQSDWIGLDRTVEIYSCLSGKLIKVFKGNIRLNQDDHFAQSASFLINGKKMNTNMCFIVKEIGIKEEAL